MLVRMRLKGRLLFAIMAKMILYRGTDTLSYGTAVLENRSLKHFRPGGHEKKAAGDLGPTAKS